MSASNNLRRFLPGSIILFLGICMALAYGQDYNVQASISDGGPQPGTITVPPGRTAAGFDIVVLTNGHPATGTPDFYGFNIYIYGTTTVVYSYYLPKGGKLVETPSPVTLATLVLNPGKYSVYVSGGPGAGLLLSYKLGGGVPKPPPVIPPSPPSTPGSLEGLWDTTIPGTVHVQLDFRRSGNVWTCRFFGRAGWENMADLRVDPATGAFSFRRPLAWAGESDQTYTGSVSGDTLSGVFADSHWTGSRAIGSVTEVIPPKERPPEPPPVTRTNLARGKSATQSSLYTDNTDYGPQIGVDGVSDRGFFHTNIEDAPWWQVDLQGTYQLHEIRLFNRGDICLERANHIQVKISTSGGAWETVYSHGGTVWKQLSINVAGKSARFVRVQLAEKNWLHLSEVEVY